MAQWRPLRVSRPRNCISTLADPRGRYPRQTMLLGSCLAATELTATHAYWVAPPPSGPRGHCRPCLSKEPSNTNFQEFSLAGAAVRGSLASQLATSIGGRRATSRTAPPPTATAGGVWKPPARRNAHRPAISAPGGSGASS